MLLVKRRRENERNQRRNTTVNAAAGRLEEKVLGDAEAKRAQGGVDGCVIWKIRTVGRRLRVLTQPAGKGPRASGARQGEVQEYPTPGEIVQVATSHE